MLSVALFIVVLNIIMMSVVVNVGVLSYIKIAHKLKDVVTLTWMLLLSAK